METVLLSDVSLCKTPITLDILLHILFKMELEAETAIMCKTQKAQCQWQCQCQHIFAVM